MAGTLFWHRVVQNLIKIIFVSFFWFQCSNCPHIINYPTCMQRRRIHCCTGALNNCIAKASLIILVKLRVRCCNTFFFFFFVSTPVFNLLAGILSKKWTVPSTRRCDKVQMAFIAHIFCSQ